MSQDHAHPAQCCCCTRASAAQAAAEEREPFRLADLAAIPRTQWIVGGVMLLVIVVLALARHA